MGPLQRWQRRSPGWPSEPVVRVSGIDSASVGPTAVSSRLSTPESAVVGWLGGLGGFIFPPPLSPLNLSHPNPVQRLRNPHHPSHQSHCSQAGQALSLNLNATIGMPPCPRRSDI